MSIYATLWRLKFSRHGDDHTGCDWVDVIAQGVPAHIGTPTPGFGYEDGVLYAAFLPPPVVILSEEDEQALRAVVFVTEGTPKGTDRSHQEYVNPLLVLTGPEYATIPFGVLHERICDALRGGRPRLVAEFWDPDGTVRLMSEDGGVKEIPFPERTRDGMDQVDPMPPSRPSHPSGPEGLPRLVRIGHVDDQPLVRHRPRVAGDQLPGVLGEEEVERVLGVGVDDLEVGSVHRQLAEA
jgi:hypothetical protein